MLLGLASACSLNVLALLFLLPEAPTPNKDPVGCVASAGLQPSPSLGPYSLGLVTVAEGQGHSQLSLASGVWALAGTQPSGRSGGKRMLGPAGRGGWFQLTACMFGYHGVPGAHGGYKRSLNPLLTVMSCHVGAGN